MAKKQRSRIVSALVGAAMLISTLMPFSALAADPDYILNISDKKVFNHTNNTTTQEGSKTLYYYGGNGSSIASDGQDVESSEPIKVTQTVTSDWKSAFWTEGSNFTTDKNTVFDIEYKISTDDYSIAPYYGLRLYTTNNVINCNGMGWRGIQPKESEKNKLHHMRFVLIKDSDGKALVKYSLDGAAYQDSTGGVAPADNWGYIVDHKAHDSSKPSDSVVDDAEKDIVSYTSQVRFMPYSLPSGGRDANPTDGVTEFGTSLNWEFYSFTAYQTDEIPDPPAEVTPTPPADAPDYILNISDQKLLNDSNNTITQDGSIGISYFGTPDVSSVTSDGKNVVSSAPIKVQQVKASEYKTTFKIPADSFVTSSNIVFNVKFKVSLEDYSQTSPYVTLRLSNTKNNMIDVNAMTWSGIQLKEADKDKMHTVRYVIAKKDDNTARIYYSYDGAEYTLEDRSTFDLSTITNWQEEFRLSPVAIPGREWTGNTFTDGVTDLSTPVNWEFHSITAYQTDTIPAYDEGYDESGEEPLPTALPVATAVPIPSDLAGQVVRAYPEGKMKAAVISLDDGANWCLESDLRAIEILKEHNAKATFNIVPGITYGDYLTNLSTNYAGMEVASHSNTHPSSAAGAGLDYLTNDEFRNELQLSKTALDNAWGSPIGGLAYPYSCAASSDPVRLRIIQDIGYRYARNCIITNNYKVPDSFYDLNPTGWISLERDWDNGTVQKHMNDYKALDASDEWTMMFLAGHAWQFNANVDEANPANNRDDIWTEFETFVQYLEDNRDIIWNPTTIELVDYVTACRQLTVTKDAEGNVSLYNPSEMNVWANVDGAATEIPAGETKVVKVKTEKPERDFTAKKYIIDIDDNIAVKDNIISDNESSLNSSLWAEASASTSDEVVIKEKEGKVWSAYLEPTSVNPSDIITDKPVVIEAKYKAELEDYNVANAPKVRLALMVNDLGIAANSGIGTSIYTPQSDSGYTTVKFILDPVTQKLYYTSDGKVFNSKDINIDTSSDLGSKLRLYIQACPSDGDMNSDTSTLTTPVIWRFDYVKMYKLEDNEALKLTSDSLETAGSTASYTINVRNHYPSAAKSGTVIAALYSNGRLVGTDVQAVSVDALSKQAVTGSFDVTGLTDYSVRAFLWDGTNKMIPYDLSYTLEAE